MGCAAPLLAHLADNVNGIQWIENIDLRLMSTNEEKDLLPNLWGYSADSGSYRADSLLKTLQVVTQCLLLVNGCRLIRWRRGTMGDGSQGKRIRRGVES